MRLLSAVSDDPVKTLLRLACVASWLHSELLNAVQVLCVSGAGLSWYRVLKQLDSGPQGSCPCKDHTITG